VRLRNINERMKLTEEEKGEIGRKIKVEVETINIF
jgi:hypothetical protein